MPFPYKHILCPIDFDRYSACALEEAAALALGGEGTLHVLHVLQITPPLDEGATGGLAVGEIYGPQVTIARDQIAQTLATLPPGVNYAAIIEMGEPGSVILNTQAKLGADLIVMATHGRRGLKYLMLGSVAERIVRESQVPVVTVRPDHTGPNE